MHNNSSSSNNTGWDCSDIAGSAQHKRKNRKTFTTYKTLFTHRHKPTVCSWVCVWSGIFLCIHIWLLRARVRNFFCGNFSFSCCTLSFCCSVVASYPTLADCTTETDGTDTRTQRTLTLTHTYTWTSWQIWHGAGLVLTSLNCYCLRCVCVLMRMQETETFNTHTEYEICVFLFNTNKLLQVLCYVENTWCGKSMETL